KGSDRAIVRAGQKLLLWTMRWVNRAGDDFFTYTKRPKFSSQIIRQAEPEDRAEPMAIVMQGPIALNDMFTLETIRIYRDTLPGVRLILSTWTDTPEADLAPIRAAGVEVVLSEKPAIPGLFNINMQLVSAGAGIRKAHADGAEWILKTRTDQRLYRPNVMGFLAAMARTFPAGGGFAQKHRIIGVGHGSLKYAPYHVTDQTVFGHADDMLAYWTPDLRIAPPPEDWPQTLPEIYARIPIDELCRNGAAESYIAASYLDRIGRPLDWTLEDSWAAYRDCFCFVDYATTDFFWSKVQTGTVREFINRYDAIWTRNELTFADWMLLYSGQVIPEVARKYESARDLRFMESITPDAVGPGTDPD
ncbi:MAG: WavE lipopolysaccharide synthesis family protein, partial [Paracoccaceae bacterium]